MHFSIPDTQEFYNEATGSTYTGYNIHINGNYHCCLRYKQLHSLHEQLRRQWQQFDYLNQNCTLPSFPPKKLLPLTHTQLEQRRYALEQYLQLIGQVPALAKLEFFQTFLLNAQHESAAAAADAATTASLSGRRRQLPPFEEIYCVDVMLMNGYQIQLQCRITDNATAVLRKACQCINLLPELVPFFCIYLVRKDAKDTLVLLRRLMDFEAPILTRQNVSNHDCQFLIRKSYWNPIYDLELMKDNIGLNMLFIQTAADVEREWIIVTPDVRKQLQALKEQGMKREYMELTRQLPLYGCLQFMASSIDYPDDVSPSFRCSTSALIAIGNRELSMRTFQDHKIYETKFRVTRMRCWRVAAAPAIHQNAAERYDIATTLFSPSSSSSCASSSNWQLSFEYLMSRQKLRWITITSAQAMLMSVSLQSMVDELMQFKEALGDNSSNSTLAVSPKSRHVAVPLSYVLRNGSGSQAISTAPAYMRSELISFAPTQSKLFGQRQRQANNNNNKTRNSSSSSSLSEYSSTSPIVFFRNAHESMHNEAFEEIGDDDL